MSKSYGIYNDCLLLNDKNKIFNKLFSCIYFGKVSLTFFVTNETGIQNCQENYKENGDSGLKFVSRPRELHKTFLVLKPSWRNWNISLLPRV